MSATAAPARPNLRAAALRLKEVMVPAAKPAPVTTEVNTPEPAPVVEPPEPESLEAIAEEAAELLEKALGDAGIQRDSIRMVLACHAIMVRLFPAMKREFEETSKANRVPMTKAERDTWKREFMASVDTSLSKLETIHLEGARDYGAVLRGEVARLQRAADNSAVWRAAGAIAGASVTCLFLGAWIMWVAIRHSG
jgi:hypothetical protein